MASASPAEKASKYAAAKAAKVDPKKVGFERSEMHSVPLAGTVKFYERHVFLTAGDGKKWPAKVEKSASTGLPARLAAAISQHAGSKKTNFMLCDQTDGAEGDVLVFPDMVKYRLQPSDDVAAIAKGFLQSGAPPGEPLTGCHVFICTHSSRDARCGYCGPLLIAAFNEAVREKGLEETIRIRGCSHTGGHKYAGNVIIYRERDGKVEGDWYGYVSPADVSALLDEHIQGGRIVERLWRGRMGLNEEQQKAELRHVETGRGPQPTGTADGTCEGCDCGKAEEKMEATPNGFAHVSTPNDATSNLSASTSTPGGSLLFDAPGKGIPPDGRSAFTEWAPSWMHRLERRDLVLGAGAVVATGFLLAWLNIQRRAAQT